MVEDDGDPLALAGAVRAQFEHELGLVVGVVEGNVGKLSDQVMSVYQRRHRAEMLTTEPLR